MDDTKQIPYFYIAANCFLVGFANQLFTRGVRETANVFVFCQESIKHRAKRATQDDLFERSNTARGCGSQGSCLRTLDTRQVGNRKREKQILLFHSFAQY